MLVDVIFIVPIWNTVLLEIQLILLQYLVLILTESYVQVEIKGIVYMSLFNRTSVQAGFYFWTYSFQQHHILSNKAGFLTFL